MSKIKNSFAPSRPMIIGEEQIKDLNKLRQFAESNPYNKEAMQQLMKNPALAPGNNPLYVVLIPIGYKVVFTIEEHPKEFYRHLSMSIPNPGKFPNPVSVQQIMNFLGFRNKLENCRVHTEADRAMNIMEPYR